MVLAVSSPKGFLSMLPRTLRLLSAAVAVLLLWVTLFHWDMPLAIYNRGGWRNREIAQWFAGGIAAAGDRALSLVGSGVTSTLEIELVARRTRLKAEREVLLERFEARRYARAAQVHALATQAARWDQAPAADTDLHGLHEALWRVVSTAA